MAFKSSGVILTPRLGTPLQVSIEKKQQEDETVVKTEDDTSDNQMDETTGGAAEDMSDDDESMEEALSALNVEVTMTEGDQPIQDLTYNSGELDEDLIDEVINEKIAEDIRNQDVEEEFLEMKDMTTAPMYEYSCNLCQFSASTSSGQWYLKKRNKKNVYYPCSMCSFMTETLNSLSKKTVPSLNTTSTTVLIRRPSAPVRKPVSLPQQRRKSLETSSSSGERRALVDFSSIKHTITGVHPCYECNFVGGNEHALQKHLQLRHANKVTSCPACDYQTQDPAQLKLHVQTKHYGERFPCHLCNFFATRKSTLKTHIASIHQGVKYPCQLCSYAATQKSALKRHMRTVHNPEHNSRRLSVPSINVVNEPNKGLEFYGGADN